MNAHLSRRRFHRFAAALLVIGTVGLTPGSPGAADGIALQPHRAVYSAGLVETETGSGIADVGGSMVVAIEKTCDGWILAQQLALDITATTGQSGRQQVRFAAWESLDGLSYRFAAREKTGAHEAGFKGSATLKGPGGPGTARFETPEKKTIKLPAGTVFPIGHTRHLIAAGRQSKKLDSRVLFEGTAIDGPQQVTAFLGALRPPKPGTESNAMVLRPGWPVRMAFFPIDGRSATPEYEIEFLQLDNGIAREFILDRGDFTMRLELKSIEAIDPPDC